MRPVLAALTALLLFPWPRTGVEAGELTVSAAASLTNAFAEVGEAFWRANPGRRVVFNFGASGALLQQIDNGAPVDVFASADHETMDKAEASGLIDRATRRDFATNRLVLAGPDDAPGAVRTLRDLGRPEVRRIAVGNPDFVPAGRYARRVLEAAGLWAILEPKLLRGSTVRQVLDYLGRGEVDAGFVFATDVAASGGRVTAREELRTRAPVVYPIAVVAKSSKKDVARKFVEFVSGSEARAVLSKHGFGDP